MWWRRGGGVARAWLRAWGREQCRDTRRGWLWAATGGSLLLGCAQAAHHTPAACLREGGVFLDPEDAQLTETCPLEMNEAAALTHTSLLRQASGVAVDAGVQLIHRTLRATLDFSQLHRKQLQEVLDMLEYCTTMLRHTEEHDRIWQLLVEARARQQSLKQQLQDLHMLVTYACAALENTAMAAYISGSEFSASAARQMTDAVKLELTTDDRLTEALEMQYTHLHLHYIEAAQRVVDEAKTGDHDDSEGDVEKGDGGEMAGESEDRGRTEGEVDDG